MPTSKSNIQNLTGRRFEQWLVLAYVCPPAVWLCLCNCGNIGKVRGSDLRAARSKSCGCAFSQRRHGHATSNNRLCSPEYNAWAHMKDRCLNPRNHAYYNYGAKGITVCEQWRGVNGFENFLADMGLRPSSNHTLDRYPDPFGSYTPENCRWATWLQQGERRRNSILVTIENETHNLSEWSRRLGLDPAKVHCRVARGMLPLEALTKPFKKRRRSIMNQDNHGGRSPS